MAQQFNQLKNRLPGRHFFTGGGALIALAGLGLGINSCLFNGKSTPHDSKYSI
jgi:hypothetical protein